ncbi:hypothetical protein DFH07DRAFT_810646 [Mycena maculata]|uniref:Secreted protein n=1 Tax=Mycena maculata TaxID=230809 RepID=A0AAD7JKX3_9AGAR|nr:hypothetical protein DFH07DRAFT_810646 [Mycena maculata]
MHASVLSIHFHLHLHLSVCLCHRVSVSVSLAPESTAGNSTSPRKTVCFSPVQSMSVRAVKERIPRCSAHRDHHICRAACPKGRKTASNLIFPPPSPSHRYSWCMMAT